MKHPSRWTNDAARRSFLVLATLTIFPFGVICATCAGLLSYAEEWYETVRKIWKRPN